MNRSRAALAAFFTFMGTMHFVIPRSFEAIVPKAIEARRKEAVAVSGVAEIAGGLSALSPRLRAFTRWWLIGLLLAVFPANVHMAVNPDQIRGGRRIPRGLLWARLPVQALMIAWVWRGTRD